MMGKLIDLTGQRFERLRVIRRLETGLWECQCDCGKVTTPSSSSLRRGAVKSCGCYNRDAITARNLKHGLRHTPEYDVWGAIVQRCTNPKNSDFPSYGGRGIDLDPRWLCFELFIGDMGNRPSSRHSVERVKNNVGYWPSNCVWALPDVQANNARSNCLITLGGRTMTVSQWCRELDMNYRTVKGRLRAYGWTAERAFSTPTKSAFKGTNNEITC